jgi:archaellum component FlaC
MEEIKNIQNQINEAKCPAILNDLERTLQELEAKTDSYQKFIINTLQPIQSNLDDIANELQGFSDRIDNQLSSLASLPLNILESIDSTIQSIFDTFNSIAGLFGINLNLSNPLKGIIGNITGAIQGALNAVEGVLSNIQNVLDKVADVFVNFSNLISNIQNAPILRIDILNDVYALNNISTKLKAYKRAQRCYGSSSSVSFITQSPKPKQNQVIVIESKKSEPKSINFLALIKNFWQPKLVEFKNE